MASGKGKRRIEIKRIEKETSRMVTFSKRKKGLFKKAQEFQSKTGSTVVIIVFSPAGKPYCHGNPASIDTALNAILNCCNVRSRAPEAASTSVAVLGSDSDRIAAVTVTTPSEEGLNGAHGGRGRGLDVNGTFAQSTSLNYDGFGLSVNNCCSASYGFDERCNLDGGGDENWNVSGFLVDGFAATGHGFGCTSQECGGFGLMVDSVDRTSDGFNGTNTFAPSTSGNSHEFELTVNNFDGTTYGLPGTTTFAASTSETKNDFGLTISNLDAITDGYLCTSTFTGSTSENYNGFGLMMDNCDAAARGLNCSSTFRSSTSRNSSGFGLLVDNFGVTSYGFNGTGTGSRFLQ